MTDPPTQGDVAVTITVQNKVTCSSLIGMHGGDGGHVIFEAKYFTSLLVFVPEIIISHWICHVFLRKPRRDCFVVRSVLIRNRINHNRTLCSTVFVVSKSRFLFNFRA